MSPRDTCRCVCLQDGSGDAISNSRSTDTAYVGLTAADCGFEYVSRATLAWDEFEPQSLDGPRDELDSALPDHDPWAGLAIPDMGHQDEALQACVPMFDPVDDDALEAVAFDASGAVKRSPWFDARLQLVHDGQSPSTTMTVMQAAFRHVEAVHNGASVASVEEDIRHNISMFGPDCGPPAPDNPHCRYPRSYYICKVVCDVGDLALAEVHVCPEPGCKTVFKKMSTPELRAHVNNCSSHTCRICNCECGGKRMTKARPGCLPMPQAPCYFFPDCLQQFFMDTEWYNSAVASRENETANFYSNPEGKRVLQEIEEAGTDAAEVCHGQSIWLN